MFALLDGDMKVGWIRDRFIGFLGFENEEEAAGAAAVACRALKMHGREREIVTIVAPGGRAGASHGFELELPGPALLELTLRARALHVYRTLRKSGVRWALWRRPSVPVLAAV